MFEIKDKKAMMYEVDSAYESYIRNYDCKINTNGSNKFYGILVSNNIFDYFIPLTRQIHKKTRPELTVDILENKNKVIAKLLINNMFPVAADDVQLVDFENEKYKDFNNSEIQFLRSAETMKEIIRKVDTVYRIMTNINHSQHEYYSKICCDFQLLEEKCTEWNKNK